MMVVLLTPDKSALLIGKPGIGKTAVVEGLAYGIINNTVPDALKGYTIFKLNTASLTGIDPITHELKIQKIVDNLVTLDKVMVFIDEIGSIQLQFKQIFVFHFVSHWSQDSITAICYLHVFRIFQISNDVIGPDILLVGRSSININRINVFNSSN